MKYDTQKTKQHMAESQFIIHGYLEQIFCKGRQIAETRHHAIPYGKRVGTLGEVFDVRRATTYTLRGKRSIVRAGVLMRRVVIPICGRMKKSIHKKTL